MAMPATRRLQKPPNAFQRGVQRVSWLLIAFMAAMVPLVVLCNGLMTGDWAQVRGRRHPGGMHGADGSLRGSFILALCKHAPAVCPSTAAGALEGPLCSGGPLPQRQFRRPVPASSCPFPLALHAGLFGISVAVGLTPEMLPMVVNANLARGAGACQEALPPPGRHVHCGRHGCVLLTPKDRWCQGARQERAPREACRGRWKAHRPPTKLPLRSGDGKAAHNCEAARCRAGAGAEGIEQCGAAVWAHAGAVGPAQGPQHVTASSPWAWLARRGPGRRAAPHP